MSSPSSSSSSSSSSSDEDDALLKQMNKSREQMKQLLLKAKSDEEESKYTVVPTCLRRIFNHLMKSSVSSDQNEALKQINKSLEEIKQLLKAKSEEEENKYSVQTCMRILNEMKISFKRNEAYVDVMKSFEKKEWREVFVNMSEEQRKAWIDTVKKYNIDVDRQRDLDTQRQEEEICSLRMKKYPSKTVNFESLW